MATDLHPTSDLYREDFEKYSAALNAVTPEVWARWEANKDTYYKKCIEASRKIIDDDEGEYVDFTEN